MLIQPHPWNEDPVPPRRYRLTVVHQRIPEKQIVAVSPSREALARLERDLAGLDYDFVRIERLEGRNG